jgi:Zn-dependent peptidase ImmA (M78 family)/transcriptional regulator with XRE-family HTH domain
MKLDSVAGVTPDVLRWARESIGLSVSDAATMMERSEDEISDWELGKRVPTYAQLEKLAYQVYKRPLAVFYLPERPNETSPATEFRTLPESDIGQLQRDTYLKLRAAHAYQLALFELFGGRNPQQQKIWTTLSLDVDSDVARQAAQVRSLLGISADVQAAWRSEEHALKQWRIAIENAGVFVFKGAFKQKQISGFCLFDLEFPLIYLNNSTTKTRQIFSLLHELAHLLVGVNGLSKFDQSYVGNLPPREQNIERFCNAIAAEVLIPQIDFERKSARFPHNVDDVRDELFSELAAHFHVSREAILRRFLDLGRASGRFYSRKAEEWASQMTSSKGGNWYVTQGVYISNRFATEVVGRHSRQELSLEGAANMLGIKPKSYPGFEQRILEGAEA